MSNPMMIWSALTNLVRLKWNYEAMCARNYFRTNPDRTPLNAAEVERLGREQHAVHVKLHKAHRRLNALLAATPSRPPEEER